MAKRSILRASDADRERIADRLREAASEGRLTSAELEERLAVTFRALTYGELDEVVSDLPEPSAGPGGMVPPTQPRWSAWGMRSYLPSPADHGPVAAGLIVFGGLMMATVAVATVTAIAFSGIWIVPLVFMGMARRRGWRGGGRGGRSGGRHRHDQMQINVHRYGRF